jgi:tetratricopeptide (TPR) repeat protein
MAEKIFLLDNLTRSQQILFAAVILSGALFVGSALFLVFAIPNNWLVPTPQNMYERNIVSAQQAVADAKKAYGTQADEAGYNPYADAQAQLILARLDAGQTTRAVRDSQTLYKSYSNHALIGYAYGRALFDAQDYETAQEITTNLVSRIESVAPELKRGIYHLQAQLYQEQKSIEAASRAYMQAACVPPASLEFYLEAAELAYAHEKWELAAEAFASALAYDSASIRIQDALMVSRAKDEDAFMRGVERAHKVTGVNAQEVLW